MSYEAPDAIPATLNEMHADLDSVQMRLQMSVSLDTLSRITDGETVTLWLDTSRIHLFDPKTGENLTRVATATVN